MESVPQQPAELVDALRGAQTALGALARIVDTPEVAPTAVVETLDSDPDLDAAIMEGVRARRAPLLAIAATGAAGWAAHGVQLAANADAHSSIVLGTAAATAVALPVLRARFRHQIPKHWRRRWWLSGTLACGWVTAAAAWGADSWPMTGALVVGGFALSARWWAEWEVPHPREVFDPEPTRLPEPPRIEPSRAAQIEQAWAQRVADGRNPLVPDSLLTGRTELPHGTQWIVELDPEGNVGATELETMEAPLARRFGVRPSHVLLERLEGDADREDRALMTVVTRDALSGGVDYEGPCYRDDDTIPIVLYGDGTGEGVWRAQDNTGPLYGVVIGGKGSGKSTLLAALGMAYRASGKWVVLFGDGDTAGNSSPLLRTVAHDFAKGDEVMEQLAALEAWYAVRGTFMGGLTEGPHRLPVPITDPGRQAPVEQIAPCPEFPGFVWFIDELHRIVERHGDSFVKRLSKMVRIIRKYGGAVIVGTQSGLVDDFGDSALRAQLLDNLVMMRSKNKSERRSVSDFGVSPSTLPLGGGYCYVDNGEGRKVMARTAYSDDMDRWVATLPRVEPDRRSGLAYARHRSVQPFDPQEHYRKVHENLAAVDIALETGAALPGEKPEEASQDGKPGRPTSVGGVSIPRAPGRATPDASQAKVIPMPTRPSEPPAPSSVGESRRGPLPANAARVLEVLRSRAGVWRSAEVAEAAGLDASAVSRAFRALAERGMIRWQHGAAEALPAPMGS